MERKREVGWMLDKGVETNIFIVLNQNSIHFEDNLHVIRAKWLCTLLWSIKKNGGKRRKSQKKRERENERTNEFVFKTFNNEGNGISTIPFYIQASGKIQNKI